MPLKKTNKQMHLLPLPLDIIYMGVVIPINGSVR